MRKLSYLQMLDEVRKGKRSMRIAWEIENKFIYHVPASQFQVTKHPLLGIFKPGTLIYFRERIDMYFGNGVCGVWEKTREDVTAHDWIILE